MEFEGIAIEDLAHEFKKRHDMGQLKSVRNIRDEFLKFIVTQTESTSLTEYLRPLIDEFKEEILSNPEILTHYPRNNIPNFLKNIEHEFEILVGENEDITSIMGVFS